MKTTLQLLLISLITVTAQAEYRVWTRNDGKTAELELVSVTEANGEKIGKFVMRNGRAVMLKASGLAEADAKLLNEWKPKPTAEELALVSVFDPFLEGNLLVLDHEAFKPVTDFHKPAKYYLFYYTASWCGPCHKYTPQSLIFITNTKTTNSKSF
jgi:thiol-disulfide isomerase/thioredoxin